MKRRRRYLRIIKILHIEARTKDNKPYYRTHALLESGEVATGYSKEFKVGDRVQYFYDDRYDTIKMRLPIDSK